MIKKELISQAIENFIEGTDKFLVDLKISGNNTITVVIDADTSVSIDDCTNLSRSIEESLNREENDFELTVYSAGLSEPLKLHRQYKKQLDKELDIYTAGGPKFTGILKHLSETGIDLEIETSKKIEGKKKKQLIKETINIPFETITTAKIVVKF